MSAIWNLTEVLMSHNEGPWDSFDYQGRGFIIGPGLKITQTPTFIEVAGRSERYSDAKFLATLALYKTITARMSKICTDQSFRAYTQDGNFLTASERVCAPQWHWHAGQGSLALSAEVLDALLKPGQVATWATVGSIQDTIHSNDGKRGLPLEHLKPDVAVALVRTGEKIRFSAGQCINSSLSSTGSLNAIRLRNYPGILSAKDVSLSVASADILMQLAVNYALAHNALTAESSYMPPTALARMGLGNFQIEKAN